MADAAAKNLPGGSGPFDRKPDVKEAKPSVNERITVKVRDQEGNEVMFKVKKATKFDKIMTAYANKMGVQQSAYAFHFDGQRVNGNETPLSLEMDDMDIIDAMLHQQGGVHYA